MFNVLGKWIARQPGRMILVWLALVAGAVAWSAGSSPPPPGDLGSFLPEEAPHNQAMVVLRGAFPEMAARSQIVVVGHRPAGLTAEDIAWLNSAALAIRQATGGEVLSPAMPFFDRRLRSADGQAAMVIGNLSSHFISATTAVAVGRVEELLDADRPDGLTVELTGTAGIGRDYAAATARAVDHTTWVTIAAVLVILIFVYRSPVGALVPLVSIGVSVYVAFVLLSLLTYTGWQISDIERIFAVVLLFGAGVDYALFWIARYRESLEGRLDFELAATTAARSTSPAILASAGTTICGLSMMLVADLAPSRNAGKVLAPVLVVAMLAALTLAPALARILGRWLFWPMGLQDRARWGVRVIWPALARLVTARPRSVLLAGLIALGAPALLATRIQPRFDSLSELPPGSTSERGYRLLEQHYTAGQLFAMQVLLVGNEADADGDGLNRLSSGLADTLLTLEGVEDVYSLADPLGRSARVLPTVLMDRVIRPAAERFYVSGVRPVARLEVLLSHQPFTLEAMALADRVRTVAEEHVAAGVAGNGVTPRVLLAGLTPYIMDVRTTSARDRLWVMTLATLVIGLVVLLLVRDVFLTTFMLLATWLTYGATLTFSHLVFAHVLGEGGLDWKVGLIVFVIVVAVGQDYNLFLVSRLLTELREGDDRQAVHRAVVSTGSVISSCGLIMAATLGSLWAGQLSLLRQVGFALALGILLDTFFVRPLLLPSFFLVARRGQAARRRHAESRASAP